MQWSKYTDFTWNMRCCCAHDFTKKLNQKCISFVGLSAFYNEIQTGYRTMTWKMCRNCLFDIILLNISFCCILIIKLVQSNTGCHLRVYLFNNIRYYLSLLGLYIIYHSMKCAIIWDAIMPLHSKMKQKIYHRNTTQVKKLSSQKTKLKNDRVHRKSTRGLYIFYLI